MKEEKDSTFPFRRKSTNRLSLHLDKKKDKKDDGQVKRASWSSFPLLRFSSSSSTSSSSSSSPMAQDKRGLGRKCNSSEEIKHLSNKNSPPRVNFQRGSNASIRSSVSTSSASSSSSGVRTGGSSSITSILEGSGSDTFSCDSYGGHTGEFHPYPVNRTASEVIHPKRHESNFGQVMREGRDECLSLPSLGQGGGKGNKATSPRILYAHRKTPDVQHRSRKQLEKELEAVRRTGSLPGGLEAHTEKPFDVRGKTSTAAAEKAKPKHKKSFSFIHNSKFLGRLEARTKREGKSPSENETDTDYRSGIGQGDKQTATSSPQLSVSLHPQESPPARLRLLQQHSAPSRVCPPSPSPPPPPKRGESQNSSPSNHGHQKPQSVGSPHTPSPLKYTPSPPRYIHQSSSSKALHRSPGQSSLSPPQNQYAYHHKPPTPVTPTPKPPPPSFLQHPDGLASSPPQYSLAAFLNYAFGGGEHGLVGQKVSTPTSPQPPPLITREPERQVSSQCIETVNPRYLETSFDSPLDFVTERNYVNLLPEVRDIRHQILFKGKDPCIPLSRSECGELELKQSFLGVIGDTIEEEEEEGAESECEIGELLCQVDSTCFERSMEDKLEEMAGRAEEEGDAEENAAAGETVKEAREKGRANKRPDLKLKLIKPENDMVKRVQRSRLLRHISEEADAVNSGGEEVEVEVEMRTPSTPRSPAIDIDNVFQQKQREIAEDTDEMSRLRDLATRLQLTTRRPSYLDWAAVLKERGRRVGEALAAHTPTVVETGGTEQEVGQEVTEDHLGEGEEELSMDRRKHNLQTAVDWVKKELTDMRQQDQQLARQLMQLRVEVQRLRLLNSCLATSCLLEEVASGAEEAKMMEASDLCDLPPDLRDTFSPVLREMGLTRMNITSRRFSLR